MTPLSMPTFMCVIGLLLGVYAIILSIRTHRRTEYGNTMLGRINGFKNFLELAEKPKLEELVEQDPAYFYNILPYTYVLGVSDKWIRKFDGIAMEPPQWYSGDTTDFYTLNHSIGSSLSSLGSSMTSQPSSSGGGGGGGYSSSGSSGGGSSGGGSGGGGGSSW